MKNAQNDKIIIIRPFTWNQIFLYLKTPRKKVAYLRILKFKNAIFSQGTGFIWSGAYYDIFKSEFVYL